MSDTALIQAERGQNATEIHLVNEAGFADWSRKLSDVQRAMLEAQRFTGKGYETAIVPAKPGDGAAWFAVGGGASPLASPVSPTTLVAAKKKPGDRVGRRAGGYSVSQPPYPAA